MKCFFRQDELEALSWAVHWALASDLRMGSRERALLMNLESRLDTFLAFYLDEEDDPDA